MGLDTKYRPTRYSDVLGQGPTIQICRELVRTGSGFEQSYVFGGAWGGGKTTIARIFARALLCDSPVDGEPCDQCHSCLSMLEDRSESFMEVDAATNSSKEDIKRITEEAMVGTFSGRRKLYLLDEAHGLSKQSMDALLKPMEDDIRGSGEKQLVAIFCTTEPEKMRNAIISRCAPVFKIRLNTPAEIAGRLEYICAQEGIEREPEALQLIAEVTECHVRDAIKAVEGVSMLGAVSRQNVETYLNLDANVLLLDILEMLGFDLPGMLRVTERLADKISPSTGYERLADLCMLLYRLVTLGNVAIPSYWDRDRMAVIAERHRDYLPIFAERFARRPSHTTYAMFHCDLVSLHQQRANIVIRSAIPEVPVYVPAAQAISAISPQPAPVAAETISIPSHISSASSDSGEKITEVSGSIHQGPVVTETGVYVAKVAQKQTGLVEKPNAEASSDMPAAMFSYVLRERIAELTREQSHGRSTRRHDMGGS